MALLERLRRRLRDGGVQSDLEWIASTSWDLSVSNDTGESSVTLERAGRTVFGRGLDLESAISSACFWVKTGMPDCGY